MLLLVYSDSSIGQRMFLLSLVIFFMVSASDTQSKGPLKAGFYNSTCPDAESIVFSVVKQASAADITILPALLRLHFHDCFVEGCDGSILISGGAQVEKFAFGHQGLRGFEAVDRAKVILERGCPGVVSCSDIVALAARDAVFLSGGLNYPALTGRRDGTVSNKNLAADMPDVSDSIDVLRSKFRAKGLSDHDLVLLSGGAHTIGTTACFFMEQRLYNFVNTGGADPAIDTAFLSQLKGECPKGGDVNVRISMDPVTSQAFDDQIFANIRGGKAVLESDARLLDNPITRQVLQSYVQLPGQVKKSDFLADFARSIIKMGNIGVKTRSSGQIRRACSSFNS